MDISDIDSEDERDYNHRPKYIHTSEDRYF